MNLDTGNMGVGALHDAVPYPIPYRSEKNNRRADYVTFLMNNLTESSRSAEIPVVYS
jgi:hypothetical protein